MSEETPDKTSFMKSAEDGMVFEMSWRKILFVTVVSLFLLCVLIGAMLGAVYMGHYLTKESMKKSDATSAVQQEVAYDAEIKAILSDLAVLKSRGAGDVHLTSQQLEEIAKMAKSSSAAIHADISFLMDLVEQIKSKSDKNGNGNGNGIHNLNSKLEEMSTHLAIFQNSQESAFEFDKQMAENFYQRLNYTTKYMEETSRMANAVAKSVIQAPKKPVAMTLTEKKERLSDLANLFVLKYERLRPKESKRWHAMWKSMLDDRNGDLIKLANERFLLALAKLKGKKSEEVADKDVYEASKIYVTYDQAKLPLPTFFMEVMEEKEAKSYEQIVAFISGAVASLE